MRNKKIVWFALSFFVFTYSIAFAQEQTAAIDGTVKNIEGQPIPGAMVTVSSPSLIGGTATAYTDESGYYRFPALGSGLYTVQARLSGFQTVIRKDVRIFVGQTLSVFFNLELVEVSEQIEVTGKPPLIDASTTAVSVIVPPEIIHNLPKRKNIEDLLALTPGVSDDLIAYGGDGQKANVIWIDGVNVSDPRNGTLNVAYDYNWIDELQVNGIGAPAEYGGFTGVLANFTTRSGGNQFHGLVETFFQNENLTSSNVPDPGPEQPFKSYDISAQIGGPLLRDKLWFFSGFQYPQIQSQPFGFDGVTTDIYKKFITKLTYKWDQNNTLHGFVHWNDRDLEDVNASANVAPEATKTETFHQSSWNATWISLWNSQTTFQGRIGGTYDHEIPIEGEPNVAGHFDSNGTVTVNDISRIDDNKLRFQANAILSHYAGDFLHGNHDFRFGVEIERSHAFLSERLNGGMTYYDYGGPAYRALSEGSDYDGRNHRVSTFVQDEWNFRENMTISAGVRWDHNRGFTDRGLVLANDPVAPRIGLVWRLDQENETVIKLHYGLYYEGLLERNYYFLTDKNPIFIFQHYAGNGQWVEDGRFSFNPTASGKLKEPYVRQVNVGIDRILPGRIPLGVHYIYKRWGNILEDVSVNEFEPGDSFISPITGETITIQLPVGGFNNEFLLTNPAGLYRRYDGLELIATKQFSSGLSISASLVYSKFSGNSPGDNGRSGANTPFLDSPNSLIYFPGEIYSSRPILWKIVGTYPLPWGFNAGWYLRHTSGNTWGARANYVKGTRPFPTFFIEPAGSRRLPSQTLLDLRFEKEFPFYRGQLRFTIDAFNLLNSAFVTVVDPTYGSLREGFSVNANFGAPQAYNAPRELRLGLRYTF